MSERTDDRENRSSREKLTVNLEGP